MPDIRTNLGRYCNIHKCIHEDEYLVCDFCNEHKWSVYYHDRYYNYGFSKCVICACNECHEALFGPFRIVEVDTALKAYETILLVIKDKSEEGKEETEGNTVDYYEAARIAYKNGYYMRRFIDSEIKDIEREINKTFRLIWKFTYKIVCADEKRVKLVNRDPDILLVSWIPGGEIYCEGLKEMNISSRST
jgi:hypothetical protein